MNKLSRPIKELLERFRLSSKMIPEQMLKNIQGSLEAKKSDFEYTLTTGHDNYINDTVEEVFIEDVIGTISQSNDISLLEYISELYNDKHEYGKRSLQHLNIGITDNIKSINDSVNIRPIKVIKIKDKYYINMDGNHKVFYLLFMYYIESELYKDNPKLLESLKNRYNIKMLVSKTSDYNFINQICYCLIKSNNRNIRMEFTSSEDEIGVLRIENEIFEIHNEVEFITYFASYFNSLDRNSDNFKLLTYWLLKIGYFNNDIVKQIHNLYDDSLTLEEPKKR